MSGIYNRTKHLHTQMCTYTTCTHANCGTFSPGQQTASDLAHTSYFSGNLVLLINYLRVSYGVACESIHTCTIRHSGLKALSQPQTVRSEQPCTSAENHSEQKRQVRHWPLPVSTYTAALRPTHGLATRLQPLYHAQSPSYASRQK